ncbi:MAG TPA: hypothetical protein DCY79_01705 [Planctomycetaceae bacterium]|nr:hypothetical protein [Blastopirellula sp.]HAY78502.1 hypothetical protein [Planctomycetaceae bacterium]
MLFLTAAYRIKRPGETSVKPPTLGENHGALPTATVMAFCGSRTKVDHSLAEHRAVAYGDYFELLHQISNALEMQVIDREFHLMGAHPMIAATVAAGVLVKVDPQAGHDHLSEADPPTMRCALSC